MVGHSASWWAWRKVVLSAQCWVVRWAVRWVMTSASGWVELLESKTVQNLAHSSVDMTDPAKDPPKVFVSDMHCEDALWDEIVVVGWVDQLAALRVVWLAVQSAVGWVDESAVLRVVCLAVHSAFALVDESAAESAVGWVDESAVGWVGELDG